VDGDATKVDRSEVDHYDKGRAALSLTVRAGENLAAARRRMRNWLASDLPSSDRDDVLLACGEALANAFEHGRPPITVEMHWQHDQGTKALHIGICDTGPWRVSAEADSRGLGIPIMTALMDTVLIDTVDGTQVRLVRQF
jgi:serine/threonine-protein kinase RsbW